MFADLLYMFPIFSDFLQNRSDRGGGGPKILVCNFTIKNVDTICAIEDYCKNNPIEGGADQKSSFAILPSILYVETQFICANEDFCKIDPITGRAGRDQKSSFAIKPQYVDTQFICVKPANLNYIRRHPIHLCKAGFLIDRSVLAIYTQFICPSEDYCKINPIGGGGRLQDCSSSIDRVRVDLGWLNTRKYTNSVNSHNASSDKKMSEEKVCLKHEISIFSFINFVLRSPVLEICNFAHFWD